jgi:serine/threonine-protein kinase
VPGVVGEQLNVAQRRLEAADLRWRVERVRSSRPLDEVIEQSPAARREVDADSIVRLRVSGGPGTVDVPAVDGYDVARATAALQDAGLTVGQTTEQYSDDVPAGIVIRTSPAAADNVDRGTSVNLYVSRGIQQAEVPDVRGFTRADADSTLRGAGFATSFSEQESSTVEAGEVISQDPSGGSDVDPGSTIAVVVARAPPVEVPGVVGQARADAESALTGQGLIPRVSTPVVDDPAQDGIVISQRPEPGTSVARGAPVRIVVGRYVAPAPPDNGGSTTPTPSPTPGEGDETGRADFGRSQGNGPGGADDDG